MPTTTELATRIMKRARILDESESPTASEAEDVIAIMQGKYEEMKELGHVHWTLTEIPTRYQEAFISVVAVPVSAEFGVLTAEMAALGDAGMRTIYALNERREDTRNTPVVDF